MIGHERRFDPLSGVLTVESTWRGAGSGRGEREHRIRLCTRRRASPSCCLDAGLVVEEAFDGWTDRPLRGVSEMLLVARKTSVAALTTRG